MSRVKQNPGGAEDAPHPGDVAANLRDKAVEIGQQVRQAAGDLGGEIRDAAQEHFDHLRATAGEHFENGRERARKWESNFEQYVQEKPMKSLLMAAGIGMILGMLWKRR